MQRRANSPYGVSKAAIEAETLIWAKDLEGTGVTVNSLIPGGAADTDFVHAAARVLAARRRPHAIAAERDGGADRVARVDALQRRHRPRFVGKLWDDALPPEQAPAAPAKPRCCASLRRERR